MSFCNEGNLAVSLYPSIAHQVSKPKPTKEEVIKYAKPQVKKFISQHASDLPREQKDEIEQQAYLRLLQLYDSIDADAGWKSFVYNHCRGAVLDYMKFGHGFQEDRWTLAKAEEHGSRNVTKINQRVALVNAEDEDQDIDTILGNAGVFSVQDFDGLKIRWELVARMSSVDLPLHAFAKWIRGHGIEEMAPAFGLSRARVGQLINEFQDRFKNQANFLDPWFRQVLFAFDLCETLGLKDQDQTDVFTAKIGWDLEPVDLDSLEVKDEPPVHDGQMNLFDG